jgi:hypothetical protein
MKRSTPPMVRVNTRITPEHHKWIKVQAKKLKRTEGEIFRAAVTRYIANIKKEL